jgi:hypothetical protein
MLNRQYRNGPAFAQFVQAKGRSSLKPRTHDRLWSFCTGGNPPDPASALLARVTGLEPATSGVTGRRSNQLSYTRSGRPQRLGR